MKIVKSILLLLVLQLFLPQALLAGGGDEHGEHGEAEGHEEEARTGPNGGRLLEADGAAVELSIFESGVPPEFRAWITDDGKPVADGRARLVVELTRLGGQVDRFDFSRSGDFWRGNGTVEEPHSFDVRVELTLDGKKQDWEWDSHEGRVEISAEMAKSSGIRAEAAQARTIERQVRAFGVLVIPPEQVAQVGARFSGLVTGVNVRVGDKVGKGDALAQVESNESLQQYSVRAPIAGVVQNRMTNVGGVVAEAPLFTLVNDSRLLAELKIFPGQREQVRVGQAVHVGVGERQYQGRIEHLIPSTDGKPYVVAQVLLDNADGRLAAGDMANAAIVVEQTQVPVAVNNLALQSFRDWTVAFIQVGDSYEIRPLELGRSDGVYSEVLSGLKAGDSYVVDNSYLIKADIEKAGASHDH